MERPIVRCSPSIRLTTVDRPRSFFERSTFDYPTLRRAEHYKTKEFPPQGWAVNLI